MQYTIFAVYYAIQSVDDVFEWINKIFTKYNLCGLVIV